MAKEKTTLDYFSAGFVQAQRKKLEKKLEQHLKKQSSLMTFPDIGDSIDDNAQEANEFESNLIMKKNVDRTIRAIKRALNRIKKGTYGICKKTKQPIEKGRLELIPEAEYTADAEPRR